MKRGLICLIALALAANALAEFPEPRNLTTVAGYCDLDEQEIAALLDRGLLVLDNQPQTNLYSGYYSLYLTGPPVYVTSDAMLYLWYEAHREALIAAEEQILAPRLLKFVAGLYKQTQTLRGEGDDLRLRENAVLLATVRALLDPAWEAPDEIADAVASEVARVHEHTLVQTYPGDDYTQYTVQGHYTSSETLSRYFRCAKYLARRIFRVEERNYPQDATRELQRAALMALAMRRGEELRPLYEGLRDLRTFLAGPVDTIGLDQLADACDAAWGQGWSVSDIAGIDALRAELADDRYPLTRINTRVSYEPAQMMTGMKIVGVLGEHYIPDSDLFMHTCEPEVMGRHLPSGLDVATALGSEEAARKLREVAHEFPQVVPTAQQFGPQMTGDSIYGRWLDTLRALFDRPEGLPRFARTAAWDDKQINACLTSWAHLRHNYILYGAQAYTVMGLSSGAGIVEPLPRFFSEYASMCEMLRERLIAEGLEGRVTTVLDSLRSRADIFERCAEDQLAGRDTSWAQEHIHDFASFIRSVYFDSPLVIADVATSSEMRAVLHAASGPFYPIAVMVEDEEGWYAAVGYVGSYYEVIEPGFGRITDEEWKSRVESEYARPEPPEWLAGLYARSAGDSVERSRLREIEELLRADLDAGVTAAEGFMTEQRNTQWEPAAAHIAARALREAEQYERTVDLLAEIDRMYGCDARDAARRGLRGAQSRLRHAERRQHEAETLEEKLAATAPREGLSPEEEVGRQDRRAEILLQSVERSSITGVDAAIWQRILDECPQSQYVPLAEMGLIYDVWDQMASYGAADPRALRAQWADETRSRFEALAEKYENSIFAIYARTAAASSLMHSGDHLRAWEHLKPLLSVEPPEPEPYPRAARWPERLRWHYSHVHPAVDAEKAAQMLIDVAAHSLLQHGQIAMLTDMMQSVAPNEMIRGPADRLGATLTYYADEPEAFARFAPCLAPAYERDRSSVVPPERILDLAQQALSVAEDHPGTRTAPAALAWAWRVTSRQEGIPGAERIAATAREHLAAEYPDSLENLLVEIRVLWRERRWDEAQPIHERAMARISEAKDAGEFDEQLPTPLEDLIIHESPAAQKADFEERLAARRERWGALVEAAGLPESYLEEHTYAHEIAADLVERLPERGFEILEAHGHPNHAHRAAGMVFAAHPDDPRTLELRWEAGGRRNLLTIVAAGPDAPRFEEAIERFVSSYPSLSHSRSLSAELSACRSDAATFRDTPAEVLALDCAGRAYLSEQRPEQAIEFLEDALQRIEEGRLLRERLTDTLSAARQQVAAKRGEAPRQLWRIERDVKTPEYTSQKPDLFLMHEGRVIIEGRTEQDTVAVVCFDPTTGEEMWRAPTAPPQMFTAAGDAIVVGTEAGLVQCIDAVTGEMRWTHEMCIDHTGTVACAASGEYVVATWDQGLLAALDIRTGEELWRQYLMPARSRGDARPALHGDLVYVWDHDSRLHAFGKRDGAVAWTWDPREVVEEDTRTRYRDSYPGTAAVIDGKLLVQIAGRPALMAALDPATGELAWSRSWGFSSTWPVTLPVIGLPGGRAVVRSSGGLSCISIDDGQRLWRVREQEMRALSQPDPGLLLVAGTGGLTLIGVELEQTIAQFRTIDAACGLVAGERDGGLKVWALSQDALAAWDIRLPSKVVQAP